MIPFITDRIRSFKPAFQGILFILRYEKNTWIHLFVTLVVTAFSILLKINSIEWLFIITAVFIVWFAEILNTAIEKTVDLITLEKNPQAKIIKDLSASFVLLSALYAVISGLVIFIPKIINLI
ncbi:MAG: diacylglycerol kinase [Anaerolineaceae bacterium]|nr:diacylglycerol kinase [Anaerolineaceae bacterium]